MLVSIISGAGGQAIEPPGAVEPPVVNPPSSVTATVTGSGEFTFGHVFGVGEFTLLKAEIAGTELQTNVMARHADGSVRHALISGATAGTVAFSEGTPPSGSVTAVIPDAEIEINQSGAVYTANCQNATEYQEWFDGPNCIEKHYKLALTPQLMARWAVRTYSSGNQRIEFIVDNCWTWETSPSYKTYNVVLTIAGVAVYSESNLKHYGHARWRKTFWSGTAPTIHWAYDIPHLLSTGALPFWDQSLTPSASRISGFASSLTGSTDGVARNAPMGIGLYTKTWADTGFQEMLAPYPQWTAMWALSQDTVSRQTELTCANQLGSYSIHYRDDATDLPITLDDYPSTMDDDIPRNDGNPNQTDYNAHMPSYGFVAYMMTGDHYYLEEMQFCVAQMCLGASPSYHNYEQGLIQNWQTRGQAWALRNMADTAYITPDTHSLKSYLEGLLEYNRIYFYDRYVSEPRDNDIGIVTNGHTYEYNGGTGIAPWQDHWFTWTIGHICELGYDWDEFLNFKALFINGSMEWTCPQHASTYSLNTRATSSSNEYADMPTVYTANFSGACPTNYDGYPHNGGSYTGQLQTALAVTATEVNWDLFETRALKPTSPLGYEEFPAQAIVPRAYYDPTPPADKLPVASASTKSAVEAGSAVTGNVMSNDYLGDTPTTVTAADENGSTITIGVAFATVNSGSLTLSADGSYSYTPPASGVGASGVTEVFNYTITDSDGDTSSSTLTISVADQAAPPSGNIPSWVPSVGVIAAIPGGTGFASAVSAPGHHNPGGVMAPWCGGAIVRIDGSPYMAIFGGGHSDSSDNTIYGFGPLDGESPTWRRLVSPSTSYQQNVAFYADGRPSAAHTYDHLVGVGSKLVATKQLYTYGTPGGGGTGWVQDLAAYSGTPLTVSQANAGLDILPAIPNGGSYGAACYNPNDGNVYTYPGGSNNNTKFAKLDMSTLQWSVFGNTYGYASYYSTMAFDSSRNEYLFWGANANLLLLGNVDTGVQTSTGAGYPSASYTMAYDEGRDKYVTVSAGDRRTINEFDPVARSWSTRSFSGASPEAPYSAGTYGRFAYVSEIKSYVLVSTSANVYVYRSHS